MFWEHAHNDLLEFPIELGLPGVLLLFGAASYLLFLLVRTYFWQNPLSASVVFGSVLMVGYAWWDFPFQCPAVLLLWCSLAVTVPIWTQFEEMNVRG